MASKVLNTVIVTVGVVVLAVLAFIAVYVIGYAFFAIFNHPGMGGGAARGVGAGIAAVVGILVLALYFRSRRAGAEVRRHARGKHAA